MTERETYTSAEIALLPRKDGGADPPPGNSAPIQLSTVSMNDLYGQLSIMVFLFILKRQLFYNEKPCSK